MPDQQLGSSSGGVRQQVYNYPISSSSQSPYRVQQQSQIQVQSTFFNSKKSKPAPPSQLNQRNTQKDIGMQPSMMMVLQPNSMGASANPGSIVAHN